MSKYYGTLESDKGTSTRAGHRYMSASAQTFDGSVTVSIDGDKVRILCQQHSGTGGRVLFQGKLQDLLEAVELQPIFLDNRG